MDHIDIMMVHERQREMAEEMNRIKLAGMVRNRVRRKNISILHTLLTLFHGHAGRHPAVRTESRPVWQKP